MLTCCTMKSVDRTFRYKVNLEVFSASIASEWHPTKNGTLKPKDVSPGSGKKVWWQCKSAYKHEWKTTVGSRKRGSKCPFCGNRVVSPQNSLAVRFPEVAESWHPTKNGSKKPVDYLPGTPTKAWWLCSKVSRHVWLAAISSRTAGRGCPLCKSQTSKAELRLYSELKLLFPDALHRHKIFKTECDVFIPSLRVAIELDGKRWHDGSLEKDRSKNAIIESHKITLIRMRGSPLPLIGKFDINFKDNGYLPKEKLNEILVSIMRATTMTSDFRLKLKKYSNSQSFQNDQLYRILQDMLPGPLPGKSFADVAPKKAKAWHPTKNHPLTPQNVTAGSSNYAWWLCQKNKKHVWRATISAVKNSPASGCPYCQGSKVSSENSLAVLNKALSKSWHTSKNGELTPKDVTSKSHQKVWWQCLHNKTHVFQAAISNRSNGRGCPYCTSKRVSIENSVFRLRKDLVEIWHLKKNGKLTSKNISSGSEKEVWWKCLKEEDHIWKSVLANQFRLTRAKHCPFCNNREASSNYNFKQARPDLAKYWHPTKNGQLKVTEVVPFSSEELWWRCKENEKHQWKDSPAGRMRADKATCPFCIGQKLCPDNSLLAKAPKLALEWHPTKNLDLLPKDVSSRSGKRRWWQCSKNSNHEWISTVANRYNGNGCPFCAGKKIDSGNSLKHRNPTLAQEWHKTKNGQLKPNEIALHSNIKVWWRCSMNKKHEWQAIVNCRSRSVRPSGCPYCKGKKVL